MDPITFVVTALVAGASAGLRDSASAAVKSAYDALRGLVGSALHRQGATVGGVDGESVLTAHRNDPDTWAGPLTKALQDAGIERDQAVLAAAAEVLRRADPEGTAAGKYTVDLRGAQGVQVGDGNSMRLTIRNEDLGSSGQAG